MDNMSKYANLTYSVNQIWIKGSIRSCGFLRISTVASLVFTDPVGGSNPVGPIL